MIPCIGAKIQGKTYYPLFNTRAMFRLQDEFPDDILDKINSDESKAGFKLAFDVFSVLCEEGAAVRRYYGYEVGAIPDWEEAELTFLPADNIVLKNAIFCAIASGYGQELKDMEKEVDIWLVELEKKTGKNPSE